MHQFHIQPIFPLEVNGVDASFSHASLMMVGGAVAASAFMYFAMQPKALVPGRWQLAAESLYGFIHDMVRDSAGAEGVKKFFPLVFSLFCFIFVVNLTGLFPYAFTPTSQVVITATMALIVFATVLIVGFVKNGLSFFKLFVPSGIPPLLYLIITPIEIISFFSRPLSHAVRLWANIFAGHVVIKVFAGFVPSLAGLGALGLLGAVVPLAMTTALYALELLVAFLQAYVFALLSCIYFNDALHAGDH